MYVLSPMYKHCILTGFHNKRISVNQTFVKLINGHITRSATVVRSLAGQICAIVRTPDDRAYTTERTEIGPMRFGPYPSAAVVTSHAKVIRVTQAEA